MRALRWIGVIAVGVAVVLVVTAFVGNRDNKRIDIFDQVTTAEGWKISGLTYTVERTGCAPSPLGHLK